MSTKDQEYDLVTNDEYDTRIPLHPDEAFTYGITFEAKVSFLFNLIQFIELLLWLALELRSTFVVLLTEL
ncbi:Uncharacterized protein OBRU01_17354 [Operophtera brumata]|uniref:Uncharacterized protein n=1 Tax=Operophtera brumata TaxID=104452 RepID=A0A0L7L191_OPEBR|nr:Uncharacterized protein OBRU01_17354 [Operophtera brumata]